MTKNITYSFVLFIAAFAFTAHAHAAFNLQQVSQYGDNKVFMTNTTGAYHTHSGVNYDSSDSANYNGTFTDNSQSLCNSAVAASGLSDTLDTYCIFDKDDARVTQVVLAPLAPCVTCDGGGITGGPGSGGTFYIRSISKDVIVYQVPLQQDLLSTVIPATNTWIDADWAWMLAGGFMGTAGPEPQRPYPPDVCFNSHSSLYHSPISLGFTTITSETRTCDVYHHTGTINQNPVATLTAAPPTVVAGGASLLTYSCSNDATAAAIDNGVGAVSPVAAGSRSVTPSDTTVYTLTCTNSHGSSTASATVTVTVQQPDLTPLSLTPHTVVAGQSSVFTATLANTGTAPTPNFSSTVYVCATSDAACLANSLALNSSTTVWNKILAFVTNIAHAATSMKITLTGGVIAAGANGTQSGSHPFASPGTYQMRLCADLPNNQVTESDENNNCGNWEVLAVCPVGNTIDGSGNCVPPQPPVNPQPTCSVTANPTSGVPSTITWSSTNATSCTGGGFSTGGAPAGSANVGTAGTYTLSCSGTGGSCPVASVTLGGGACTNPTATITAAQTRIRSGGTTTITYAASGVSGACTVTGPGAPGAVNPASCNVGSTSFPTPALQTQTTYTITCPGATSQVIVNVIPKFIEF
ncbi:MAG: hypothetical protein JWL75_549 [Parcubacteria group bacterium]|nr:hypothetical protein [Parcubacteria group bacterium]